MTTSLQSLKEKALTDFNKKFPNSIYSDFAFRDLQKGWPITPRYNSNKEILSFLLKQISLAYKQGQEEIEKDKENWLKFFSEDIKNCFIPKCGWCGEIATEQTQKGKDAQKSHARPINWGYSCKSCYAKGLKEEEEAMYG